MSDILYVGYGTAEAFERERPIGAPVNVSTITEDRSGAYGVGRAVTTLVLSYHEEGSAEVAYLYIPIDQWQTLHGEPLGDNTDAITKLHQHRAETAKAAAVTWLDYEAIPYREGAVISFPQDLILLEGSASWLVYDKVPGTFRAVLAKEGGHA